VFARQPLKDLHLVAAEGLVSVREEDGAGLASLPLPAPPGPLHLGTSSCEIFCGGWIRYW